MSRYINTGFGASMSPSNPWTCKVHSEMAREGLSLTYEEIEQRFGSPSDMLTRRVIENAVTNGWFAMSGERRKRRYTAIQREPIVPAERDGYGYGIGRVRSVFELAEAQ